MDINKNKGIPNIAKLLNCVGIFSKEDFLTHKYKATDEQNMIKLDSIQFIMRSISPITFHSRIKAKKDGC